MITALASVRPDGIGATIDWLAAHRDQLAGAYATGARHAELLEQIGNINLQTDRRAWPLAVTRRIAARAAVATRPRWRAAWR